MPFIVVFPVKINKSHPLGGVWVDDIEDWCRTSLQKLSRSDNTESNGGKRKIVKEARQTPTAAEPCPRLLLLMMMFCKLVSGVYFRRQQGSSVKAIHIKSTAKGEI